MKNSKKIKNINFKKIYIKKGVGKTKRTPVKG